MVFLTVPDSGFTMFNKEIAMTLRIAAALVFVLLATSVLAGCNMSSSPSPCRIDFAAEPTEVVGFIKIQFTDLSKGEIESWAWDFQGDGTIDSVEQNPTHTYSLNGIYSVTLTISTPDCEISLTKKRYINVTGCAG